MTEMRRYAACVGCLLLVFALSGCSRDPIAVLDSAEMLTLYSIDPAGHQPADARDSEEWFYGFRVLGKVEISDAQKRDEIIDAFKDGMARPGLGELACFDPRHGIRISQDGATTDYVICFHYQHVYVYYDGTRGRGTLVAGDPQSVFDKHLREAGVKLAPRYPSEDE